MLTRRDMLATGLPLTAAAAAVFGSAASRMLGQAVARGISASRIDLADFGISGRSDGDVSASFQQAIDEAARQGGGTVSCPPGLIWAKGLVVPNNVTISGAGVGATTIKIPDGANSDLLRQSNYETNKSFANLYFGLRDLTLDGNNAENERGNLVVLRGYRGMLERVRFVRAAGHGVLYSEASSDGTLNQNGLAENAIRGCYFDACGGAGIYADNGAGNKIADMFIVNCVFNGNGSSGFYQIDLERSAGFHIKGNQMYRGHLGDIRALGAGALIIALNHFDGTQNQPVDGVVRQVYVQTGGWGNVVITGNLFNMHNALVNSTVKRWVQLVIDALVDSSIAVTGNSFYARSPIDVRTMLVGGKAKKKVLSRNNAEFIGREF